MEVIQPFDLESAYRTLMVDGKYYVVLSSKLFFSLQDGEPLTGSQAYETLKEQALEFNDEMYPKLSSEFLVVGEAKAPAAIPVTAMECTVKLAGRTKALQVIGDRYWLGGITGATEPVPFSSMPLTWHKAFGGPDVNENPLGKGRIEEATELGEKLVSLPNLESTGQRMTAKRQMIKPQSFAAVPFDWPQRSQYLGTYDDAWKRDAFPGFPADFNFKAFYCGSEDQRFDHYLTGGEAFQLTNMNADAPQIQGALPEFRVRNFVVAKGLKPEDIQVSDLQEVPMRLDTVVFYPNRGIGALVYRGSVPSETMDGEHLQYLLSAYESRSQEPRATEHYQNSLVGRTHPDFSLQYSLTTKDLIPDGIPCSLARLTQAKEEPPQLIAENMKNRALREEAEARAGVEQQLAGMLQSFKDKGMDTTALEQHIQRSMSGSEKDEWQLKFDAVLEKLIPGASDANGKVDLQKIDFRAFDELSALSEEYAQFQKNSAKKTLQDQIDELADSPQVQKALQEALTNIDLPPQLPRPQHPEQMLKQLRDAQQAINNQQERARSTGMMLPDMPTLDLDDIEQKLFQSAEQLREAYRLGAHSMGFGRPVLDIQQQMQEFERRVEAGLSHRGQDYAGLNFSGRDLRGIDLSQCFLEQCVFDECNLRSADLSGSIAVRCSFINSDLSLANLSAATIGASDFNKARLNNAQLNECEYSGADFTEADLSNTCLTVMNSLDVTFKGCNLTNTQFDQPTFINADFSQACLSGSSLVSATFMNCDLIDTDFSQSDCSAANFIECNAQGGNFSAAILTNARFMMETCLDHSSFVKAELENSNLRQASIVSSDFSEANLRYADLSGAKADKAIFNAADLRESQCVATCFVNAQLSNCNLMEANLMQSDLQQASIRNSNCYATEFMAAVVGKTDFSGSNMDASKLEDWRPSSWPL
ncbi:DUF2169 family type VI secretion system accessory protein [Bacterioplanoides sp.]|uniref:DUF2169 family type VI secretion system accessory protein n=1 Tax=Bacterioplanoides sp. TaxID=2066072 RepID=UPI003B00D992